MNGAGDGRRLAWSAAAAALLGWWLAPLPEPVPALVKARGEAWSLPPLARVFDQTRLAVGVLDAPYWGPRAAVGAAAISETLPDPRWRIAAIFGQGPERGVLVEFNAEGKAPLRLKAGDSLPSGHRIVRIDEREVCIQIGSRQYNLGVERSVN